MMAVAMESEGCDGWDRRMPHRAIAETMGSR